MSKNNQIVKNEQIKQGDNSDIESPIFSSHIEDDINPSVVANTKHLKIQNRKLVEAAEKA